MTSSRANARVQLKGPWPLDGSATFTCLTGRPDRAGPAPPVLLAKGSSVYGAGLQKVLCQSVRPSGSLG
jgi:hypothetical protein